MLWGQSGYLVYIEKVGMRVLQLTSSPCTLPDNVASAPSRGKVMSVKTDNLQAPGVLDNLIYSRHPFLQKSIKSCETFINSCKY